MKQNKKKKKRKTKQQRLQQGMHQQQQQRTNSRNDGNKSRTLRSAATVTTTKHISPCNIPPAFPFTSWFFKSILAFRAIKAIKRGIIRPCPMRVCTVPHARLGLPLS